MRTFNVGILGCGVISRTYVSDIQAFYPRLKIVACADVSLALAEKLAREFDIPKACLTEELLADEAVEIVVNLTPPQLHVALDRQIIAAGKHLFSEKPFADVFKYIKISELTLNHRIKAIGIKMIKNIMC